MFQTEKMAETLSEPEYSEWTLYLENSIDSEQNPSIILFSIFIVLSTYARRMKNISHFKEIVDRFGERFIEYPLYPHVLSLLYKEIGTAEAIKQAVAFAKRCLTKVAESGRRPS